MKNVFKEILIFVVFLLISFTVAIMHPSIPDWDFASYHYYNGWAFLNDRINIDFLPSLFRSYFNPILDSLMYISITKLNNNPLLFTFLTSIKYVLLMFLGYKFYDCIFSIKDKKYNIVKLFCFILAISSPVIILCINFDFVDNLLSAFIILALYILITNNNKPSCLRRNLNMFIAAVIIGMVVGLKYSFRYLCISI